MDDLEQTINGLDRTSCDSLFQSEMVLGKNEYSQQSTREERTVNVSQSECGELAIGRRYALSISHFRSSHFIRPIPNR